MKGLKLTAIRAEDIKVLIGACISEAFYQLDIKPGDKGEPIEIKRPFGWAVFGSKCVCKSNINQIFLNCLSISSGEDLNNTLRNFWKMDSEIIQVSDGDGLSQDDEKCLAHLDSMAGHKEGNMKFYIMERRKKIISKQA